MKYISPILVALVIVILAAAVSIKSLQVESTQQRAESAESDNAELTYQLATANAAKAAAEKQLSELNATVATTTAATKAKATEAQSLSQKLASLTKQRDELAAKCDRLSADLETAKKEAREAAKLALKESRNSCPPPEVVPKDTQAQEFSPYVKGADGDKRWRTDWTWCESKAKELGRLQFVCWGTRSCPHCDWFMEQCSTTEVATEAKKYVPCWITVQDRQTMSLADLYEVNQFRYPAAMLRDPKSGKSVMWRPSKDTAIFLKELADHAKALK